MTTPERAEPEATAAADADVLPPTADEPAVSPKPVDDAAPTTPVDEPAAPARSVDDAAPTTPVDEPAAPARSVDDAAPSAIGKPAADATAPAESAPAKKAPRKKAVAKAADPAKKTAAKKAPAKAPAKKAAAKSTTPRKTTRKPAAPKVEERVLTPRRLADSAYREEQFAARYEGPIAPFNHLVDKLIEESGDPLPYLAPIYGGTEARLLSLFRDPGPKTRAGQQNSGLLSPENDDQAAERYLEFFQSAKLRIDDLITWNTYPWYTSRKPSTADIDRGLAPLEQVIALLPKLKVVLAHGLDAQAAWRRFERQHPEVAGKLIVIPTYHTSKQALFTQDEAVRAQREDKLRKDFAQAAEHLVE
ncbi:uracil-DNA glycosylase [Nocardia harenae]|uniref:uracil-DNA glycosylase n=1 Tax=Nocardia harenae TaxID=358707 RepID=UPI001FE19A1A|nr:uracil-DNA glycosylase [Nocardia harenae]